MVPGPQQKQTLRRNLINMVALDILPTHVDLLGLITLRKMDIWVIETQYLQNRGNE